ncbi:hypothetical protein MPL3365_210104 [Mesorhizobium plurifarium]|uniref:Uncharacterized protein n=1 Tax=Mesorhizobium plurifarium TaxID=69974 RepID=A0A090GAF3_MESPL|nr:hypothetical protein MPL3365_210104 [Mesorhizobium plurifarium]
MVDVSTADTDASGLNIQRRFPQAFSSLVHISLKIAVLHSLADCTHIAKRLHAVMAAGFIAPRYTQHHRPLSGLFLCPHFLTHRRDCHDRPGFRDHYPP